MRFWKDSEGERKPVLLTLGQSFLVGLPRVFTATAATAIFLAHFPAVELPYAYLLSGLLLTALGILYVRAERRFQLAAGVGTFVLLAVALLGSRLLLAREAFAPLVAFALVLLSEAEFTLTNVTFWSLANRVFRAREAARAFGLISAGEVVPSVLGGLLIPVLVRHVAVADLLYLSTGAHLLSAGYLLYARRALRARLAEPAPEKERRRGGIRALFGNRYLRFAAALLCLNVVVFYFVDNAFYGAVQAQLSDPTAVAGFLGGFFVALGVFNFLFKVVLSPRWRAWFGMRVSLLTTPASLAVCCLLVLFAPVLGGAEKLFATVVMLKLVERVFIEGVHNPTYYALFQPLPVGVRTAAQNAIETVIAQGATLFAAVVLIGVGRLEGGVIAATLVAATLGVLVVWLLVAFVVGREYSVKLQEALGQRSIAPRALSATPDLIAHLEPWLRSENVGQVLYALQWVRDLQLGKAVPALAALLDRDQPAVVETAGLLLAEHAPRLACDRLLERLRERREAGAQVRTAWVKALAATALPEADEALRGALRDPAAQVRAAAAAGLIRGAPEGRRAASAALGTMARSADPADREAAALALGAAGEGLAAPLGPLLDDRSVSVRQAAIRAAAASANPTFWPRIIAGLEDPLVRPIAARALAGIGAQVAPALVQALPGLRAQARPAVLAIAAELPTPETEALFAEILEGGVRDAALEAVELLAQTGRRAAPSWTAALERRLAEEIDHHAQLAGALEAFRDEEFATLLLDALEGEQARCALAVVSLLALLHEPELRTVGRQMQLGHTSEELGLTLEYLESVLPPDVLARVQPVFSPLERNRAVAGSAIWDDPHERFVELIYGKAPWVTNWIRTCAAEVSRATGTGVLPRASTIERVTALWSQPLFRHVRGARVARIGTRAMEHAFQPGEVVVEVEPGRQSNSGYVVLEGTLESEHGEVFEFGDAVGLLWALQPGEAPARVIAKSAARVLEISGEDLQLILREDFGLGWQLMLALCRLLQGETSGGARPERVRGAPPAVPSAQVERILTFSGLELFRGLDEGVLGAVSESADERVFEPGELLIEEGELGTRMFVLVDGRARVERGGTLLATLAAPDVIGELAALVPAPRAATVRAELPTRALVLERTVLFALMRAHPVVVRSTLRLLARRVLTTAGNLGSPTVHGERSPEQRAQPEAEGRSRTVRMHRTP